MMVSVALALVSVAFIVFVLQEGRSFVAQQVLNRQALVLVSGVGALIQWAPFRPLGLLKDVFMEFLGFTLSVWAAIAIGVFFLAFVLSCTADRHGQAGAKWGVLALALVVFILWQWVAGDMSWAVLLSAPFWKNLGLYLAIGLGYSLVEFFFEVRRDSRQWGKDWEAFKANEAIREGRPERVAPGVALQQNKAEQQTLEQRFVSNRRNTEWLVNVTLKEGRIEPVINRKALAENISCWTLFWPAYAVSLILGDLLEEIFRKAADFFVMVSGRFVRATFAKSFKP